jgi:Mg/Co/Ni transporter MgtE
MASAETLYYLYIVDCDKRLVGVTCLYDLLRADPAIVSGPFMSTLVDATGLLIYLRVAKMILGL